MSLTRMDIRTIAVGAGPVPSVIVLQPSHAEGETPTQLPIRIGTVEAMAITMGLEQKITDRPMTHDLLLKVIESLDAKLTGVSIVDVHDTTFYAELTLTTASGRVISIDSRPSDAIALAVRFHAPIYAEDSVLRAAALPDFKSVEQASKEQELERFHDFVESLSPSDFAQND